MAPHGKIIEKVTAHARIWRRRCADIMPPLDYIRWLFGEVSMLWCFSGKIMI
jgi:hypothetical protein